MCRKRLFATGEQWRPQTSAAVCRRSRTAVSNTGLQFRILNLRVFIRCFCRPRGMSRALLKLQRRLDSRLRNHLRRFLEPELRVARSERRHQLGHVLTAFDTAEALGRFQHPGGDPA